VSFSLEEKVLTSLFFSLPAVFAWLGWIDEPFARIPGRDWLILAAATAAMLGATGGAKGLAGLRFAVEQGLVVSIAWAVLAVILARVLAFEVVALDASAGYTALAALLFYSEWHLIPLTALAGRPAEDGTQAASRLSPRLAAAWLGSVALLDAAIASAAAAAIVSGGALRLLGVAALAGAGLGLFSMIWAARALRAARRAP
jgi:hypothetical protein